MLDIIITHYREPFETGKPLLDMIDLQRGISFDSIRVMIVNDGEEHHIPDELLTGYRYRIEQIDIPHGGVSAARNAGMDHADAEWITFCDFDDTYTYVYALMDVLNVMDTDQYDLLWTKLIKDDFSYDKDGLIIAPEKTNFVFIHGKFYRREWLIENGIRFDEGMTYQEDSLFNAYIVAILDYHRVGEIKTMYPPFAWCRRRESVTTTDGHQDPANWGHMIRNRKLCKFYRERLPRDRLEDMVVRSVFDAYYMMNGVRISTGMKVKILREFVEFLREYGEFYRKPNEDTLRQIEDISWRELEEAEQIKKVGYETVTAWKERMI